MVFWHEEMKVCVVLEFEAAMWEKGRAGIIIMERAGGTRHGARRRINEQWASRSSGRKEEAMGWT